MIFVLTEPAPNLFVFLNEEDVIQMRKGLTKTVLPHHLQNRPFTSLVVALCKTNDDARQMLEKVGHRIGTDQYKVKDPDTNKAVCNGCSGDIPISSLFEGRCIVCWADEAKKFRVASN